jgi:hypothetical protein
MVRADDAHPIRIEGDLDERLSRWLWLIKWLLLIPHFIALVVLGLLFVVLTVIAGLAILVTARYPQGIFVMGLNRWVFASSRTWS